MPKEKNIISTANNKGAVKTKTKPLCSSLRNKWIGIIKSCGAKLGLSSCEIFIENKMANEIFFKGLFNDIPCIVKCSSIAPDSIENEYEKNSLLYKLNPTVFPKPLAKYTSSNGKEAFIVTKLLSGPSLTEIIHNGVDENTAKEIASDVIQIAQSLNKLGIVHGDIIPDNLIMDSDGHLKLIDFQFAINRNSPKIDPWLKKNPKFRFLLQGANSHLGLGVWNDAWALIQCLEKLPQYEVVKTVMEKLSAMKGEMEFKSPPDAKEMFILRIHLMSLYAQRAIHFFSTRRRERIAGRIRKLNRLMGNR